MKRLSIMMTILCLAGLLAPSLAAHAQAPDPASAVRALTAAINARNLTAALALFAEDAVFVAPTGEQQVGRNLVRAALEIAVAGNPYEVLIGEPQVTGDRVTWLRDRYDDTSRSLGVAPLRSKIEAVVRQDKLRSFGAPLTPDSEARLQAAQAALAVVQAFEAAQNAGDIAAALALFADDAVGTSADGQRWTGKEQIRLALESSVAPHARTERVRYQVAGDRVTSLVNVSSRGLQTLGIAALQVSAETMVRDGKIKATTSTFTPESAARFQAVQNRSVAGRFLDQFNAHDVEGLIQLLAPSFLNHDASANEDPGIEGARSHFSLLFEGAPDIWVTMDLVVTERDLLVARVTYGGTHAGPLFGMPPTDKQFTATGTEILRVQGGQIVERWGSFDQRGLLRQLEEHRPGGARIALERG